MPFRIQLGLTYAIMNDLCQNETEVLGTYAILQPKNQGSWADNLMFTNKERAILILWYHR